MPKRCCRCKEEKDEAEFNANQWWCKACTKMYRAENAAHLRELSRQWQSANREKVRESNRRCQANHKLERRRAQQRYYRDNRERILARNKVWRDANPQRIRAAEKRRAKLERQWSRHGGLTTRDVIRIVQDARGICTYCGDDRCRLTIDHRLPLSRGGTHTKDNVLPACLRCNQRKGQLTEEEFRAEIAAGHVVFDLDS